jgi:hypothetical protein
MILYLLYKNPNIQYRQNSRLDKQLTRSEWSVACSSCSVPHDNDIKINKYLPSQSPSSSTSPPCLLVPYLFSIFSTSFPPSFIPLHLLHIISLRCISSTVPWTTTVLSGPKSVKIGHGCSNVCHFVLHDHLMSYKFTWSDITYPRRSDNNA